LRLIFAADAFTPEYHFLRRRCAAAAAAAMLRHAVDISCRRQQLMLFSTPMPIFHTRLAYS